MSISKLSLNNYEYFYMSDEEKIHITHIMEYHNIQYVKYLKSKVFEDIFTIAILKEQQNDAKLFYEVIKLEAQLENRSCPITGYHYVSYDYVENLQNKKYVLEKIRKSIDKRKEKLEKLHDQLLEKNKKIKNSPCYWFYSIFQLV